MLMGQNPLKLLRDTWSGENQLPQFTILNLFLNFWQSYKVKFRKFTILQMNMLLFSNRDTQISIIREQSINTFRLDDKSLS